MTEPYIFRNPGDAIIAEEWNKIQIMARDEIRGHDHTGGDRGVKLGGNAIDPATTLTVARANLGVAPANPNNLALSVDGRAELRVGAGDWRRLVVTTTAEWGDGDANQYLTLGAGGGAGIMLSNPHITWRDNRASLRYGRTGSQPGATYWDVGLRPDGSFSFVPVDGGANAQEKLKIGRGGEVALPGSLGVGGPVNLAGSLSVAGTVNVASTLSAAKLIAPNAQLGAVPATPANLGLSVDGRTEIRLGDDPWRRLVVTTTSEWGDGDANQYVTLGAGGAYGVMLSNPHVTWRDSRASIRFGRTGGQPGGTYWDVGTRTDGSFSLISIDGGADGAEKLKVSRLGNVGIGTGGANPLARLQIKGGAIMPEVGNSEAAGILWPKDPGGGAGDTAFIRYSVETGETTTLRIGITNDADDSLRLYQQNADRLIIQNGQVTIDSTPYAGPQARALNVPGELKVYGGGAGLRLSDRNAPAVELRDWVIHCVDNRMLFWRGDIGTAIQFDGNTVYAPRVQLGNKWLLSAAGDGVGNDDWLRLVNPSATNQYYGGLAAGRLWCSSGQLSGSDLRRKQDVTTFGAGLDTVLQLRGVRFRWREDGADGEPQIGLIAQEVEEVLPELVHDGPDGLKCVQYDSLIAPMIEAIKEQQAQIEGLRRELAELRSPGGRADNA